MIQFNLLPDVKLEYVKSRRSKHTVLMISVLVGGASLGLLCLMFVYVGLIQKKSINDLTTDIKTKSEKLESTQDLDKILTIQNQLASLNCPDKSIMDKDKCLHDKKPQNSRIFSYMEKLTPNTASIGTLNIDYGNSTMVLTGSADAISTINKFVDTYKFTNYKVAGVDDTKKAFSDVVLGSFGLNIDTQGSNKKATYSITLKFDPAIFDLTKNVELIVPKITSTRSETEKPNALFEIVPTQPQEGAQ